MTIDAFTSLFDLAALERPAPRYASYPTAPHFSTSVSRVNYRRWLGHLPQCLPIALYIHIPFCRRICWYCACRTQSARCQPALDRYAAALAAEAQRVAGALGPGRVVERIHWGGGSPSALPPELITQIDTALRGAFSVVPGAEVVAELDTRDLGPDRLDAFADAELASATLSVPDYEPTVQQAIGRVQTPEEDSAAVAALRQRGLRRLSVDLLYGLPRQSERSLVRTVERVLRLAPDRVALYGYAHLPWLARRQTMIDAAELPRIAERLGQSRRARMLLLAAGFVAVGHDHFARPGDPLAEAAGAGRLTRCFEGYRAEGERALIGLGASAVSVLPQGYVQNEPVTADYLDLIEAGRLGTAAGCALSLDDRVRRDAIWQILCSSSLDLQRIERRFGDFSRPVKDLAGRLLSEAPAGCVLETPLGFAISERCRAHAPLIAAEFDAYHSKGAARHPIAL